MRGATTVLSAVPIIIVLVATLSHAGNTKAEAKERFDKGVALFKDGDYDAALVEFRAAYNAQPHYAVRYNIGICLHKLHRYKEAFEQLEAYLLEGGDEVPDKKQIEVQGILDELRAMVGMVKVKCTVEGAAFLVDGEPTTKWTVVVDVGEHEITVQAPGYKPFKKSIEVPGGKALSIEAKLVPEKEAAGGPAEPAESIGPGVKEGKKKLPPPYFWSGVGLTGALAVTAIITGGLALKKEDEYAKMDASDDWRSFRTSTRQLSVATDGLWGLAGAAAITTVVLGVFTEFKKGQEKQALVVSPTVGVYGLEMRGEF